MTMNVFVHNPITIVMCTAHDIIWLFYYSTFKCQDIFTFHIFGFALSMLRHGRESEKTMSHAPLLSGNSRPKHCQPVNEDVLMDIFLEILVLKAKYRH